MTKYYLIRKMGKNQFYLGGGEEAKHLNFTNMMIGVSMQMMAEAVVLSEKLVLTLNKFRSYSSAVGSPLVNYKKDVIVEGKYPAAFSAHDEEGLRPCI